MVIRNGLKLHRRWRVILVGGGEGGKAYLNKPVGVVEYLPDLETLGGLCEADHVVRTADLHKRKPCTRKKWGGNSAGKHILQLFQFSLDSFHYEFKLSDLGP